MVGETLFGYQITDRIGSGSFGTVYKAEKTNIAGKYIRAIKHITLPSTEQYVRVLNSMGGDYAKANDYFENAVDDVIEEIRIISELSERNTPNIVNYYDSDIQMQENPRKYDIFILMEYLRSLPEYMLSQDLKVKDVISLGRDILTGLIACHDSNIIHRDIKDDNIFVNSRGVFKLGDFGVSKFIGNQSGAVSIKGTPEYIAPEVYLGKGKYDVTVDLYSLGIVLYRLLNRSRNPFMPEYPNTYNSSDEDFAFQKRMNGETPELPIDAKNELGEVVVKALLERNKRYNSASEFLLELKNAEKKLPYHELDRVINKNIQVNIKKEEDKQYNYQRTIGAYIDSPNIIAKNEAYDKNLFETISIDLDINKRDIVNESNDELLNEKESTMNIYVASFDDRLFLEGLFEVLDDMDKGLKVLQKGGIEDIFFYAIKSIYDSIIKILSVNGIRQMETIGKQFDYREHEAVGKEHKKKYEHGKVIAETHKGYYYLGKIIRVAKVIVAE